MVLSALIAALLTVFAPAPAGGAAEPDFAAHRVTRHYAGDHAPLRLGDPHSRRLRSALTDAYDGEVDFAGRYVLAEIGCGAGCIEAAAIDARTGAVHWLPGNVSDWPKAYPDPIEHRTDSRLLVVHGRLGERGGEGPHAFVFDGHRFLPH